MKLTPLGAGDGVEAEVILILRQKYPCPDCDNEEYRGDEFWPPCPTCGGAGYLVEASA